MIELLQFDVDYKGGEDACGLLGRGEWSVQVYECCKSTYPFERICNTYHVYLGIYSLLLSIKIMMLIAIANTLKPLKR